MHAMGKLIKKSYYVNVNFINIQHIVQLNYTVHTTNLMHWLIKR